MFMTVNEGSKKTPKSKHAVPMASGSKNQEEWLRFDNAQRAHATKKNTVWGIKLFQDWNLDTFGKFMEMKTVSVDTLADALTKFYCEAKPKHPQKRLQFLPDQEADKYHKNTLLSIRGAINRHLQDISRDIDIVRDQAFRAANKALDDVAKETMKLVKSKSTSPKDAIDPVDLQKISSYLQNAPYSATVLRHCVWFNLSIHFMACAQDFHVLLRRNCFEFHSDENGEFVTLSYEMQKEIEQHGIRGSQAPWYKPIYATGSATCPVKTLKLLLNKTDKNATHLFNYFNRDAVDNPLCATLWFTAKRISKRTLYRFMVEICRNAIVENHYTPHSLKSTAIQSIINKGHEARYIMSMAGPKKKCTVKFRNETYTSEQQKSLSTTLSAITACDTTKMPKPSFRV